MALAIALVLLVIGTVVFHVASPWWFTPIASNWGMMDDTVKLTFWVTGAVFVAVNLFMAYCVVRYRHRKGREQRSEYEPENRKLEWWLTILTSVGVAAMLAPGLFVWAKFVTVPDDAVEVEAVGQQWTWSYRLPGEDGVLGATDASFVTVTNPFGMDASDDKGRDDVLVADPELHLPINQPVKMRAQDVCWLHGGPVPRKMTSSGMVTTCGSAAAARCVTALRERAALDISRCAAAW
jgi:cytochrome c oxidase subunit 2